MGVFDYFNKKKENKTNDKEKNGSEKKSNKRKTLVKDFEEIVERGNEEEILGCQTQLFGLCHRLFVA